MVYQGEAIGLLEVLDHVRERRFSRQEMRLAHAVAGQAAVALHNAKVFAQLRRSDEDVVALRSAVERIGAGYATLHRAASRTEVLQLAASLAAEALGALSCVASCGADSAGASGLPAASPGPRATRTDTAHVIVSSAPCGSDTLALTLTRGTPAGDGLPELLGLVATIAAGALTELGVH